MSKIKRRSDCPDKEQSVVDKTGEEYRIFRYKMLSQKPRRIYKHFRKIYFYESLHEYLSYQEQMDDGFIRAAYGRENLLAALWKLYRKCEYFSVMTWDGIEELLQEYTRRHEKHLS